jgi:hypothetical protein
VHVVAVTVWVYVVCQGHCACWCKCACSQGEGCGLASPGTILAEAMDVVAAEFKGGAECDACDEYLVMRALLMWR